MKNIYLIILLLGIISCSNYEDTYVETDELLNFVVPSNFPEVKYNIESNPPTKFGFELGKKLFYDGKLSSSGFISCGFCHEQRYAFTHHGHQFSHGVNDREGTRNAPMIANMAFLEEFAWDGATANLDLFPIIPITNEVEMDETMSGVLDKISSDAEYRDMFAKAFEDGAVNNENFLKALSQFMLMMVSSNSKYDQYVRGENGVQLSEKELTGLDIFKQKCAGCHATDLFTDGSFRNNGLPPNPALDDLGRALVSGSTNDEYKFKVPSLRNIALTAPYMHDGRFGSLEAVLDFYDHGVVDSPTIDPLLQSDNMLGISIKAEERDALIAFMNTLTDTTFINDERFSEY
ncbi:cytochrome-c peroxidase [Abyssalbus ytuae]|uniref:Cytochrome-c peroxidase n=1 Tax=Abyssalbus ytuae TaxID=2926907 RepID=A0A9E6ZNB8_9FLAO|nr:cytochrome c peroxidase [Abyssalbus ytuae]UOB17475.1 cytochrome-c peroxidase [Abyssalbus ytuae]